MIYFDNGATTFPKPPSVVNAVTSTLKNYGANPGRSGHSMSLKAAEIMYNCRESAVRLFNAKSPEKVIFTNNCTTALNIVIKGILKRGDHCIISSLEHNAVVRPLEFLTKNHIEYTVAECVPYDDEATIDNFRKAIKDNTKLIICTHASNVFGIKLPIERLSALAHIYGIQFCVDAAQTAGVVPISLKDSCIDFLCTAGHKGLYGPMGTGLLIINSKKTPDSLIQGGTGSLSANLSQPNSLPDKYESGTPNLPGIAGLNEGIKFVIKNGVEKIDSKEMLLAQRLYDGLKNINGVILYTKRPESNNSVPVISFNINGFESEKTARLLDKKFNIAVRAGLHCAPLAHNHFNTNLTGTVRAVISVYSTSQQINYFINAIKSIIIFQKKNLKRLQSI